MIRKKKQDVAGTPASEPQPGLARKMLKLRPETQELLTQVAAFRGEKFINCIHSLLVEEVRRNAHKMKERIDQLATLALPNDHDGKDEDD